MIENLQSVNVFSPPITEILANVLVSLACSFVVSLIYRYTYKGPGYTKSFVNSIIFLSIITSLVIMIIGNNLARAFGLVGALSIIRFRTAIKDTVDIVYIFLSLTIGMACGVGYHKLAVTGTIVVGLVLVIFSNEKYKFFQSNQYMLQFAYSAGGYGENEFMKILARSCNKFEVINIRSDSINNMFEYSFYINVKKNNDISLLLNEIKTVEGIKNINVFYDRQSS